MWRRLWHTWVPWRKLSATCSMLTIHMRKWPARFCGITSPFCAPSLIKNYVTLTESYSGGKKTYLQSSVILLGAV
jgi:hypothetical protein